MQTIDGRYVSVGSSGPTPLTWQERFPGLGMPTREAPERGDLIVSVNINMPKSLTVKQKKILQHTL